MTSHPPSRRFQNLPLFPSAFWVHTRVGENKTKITASCRRLATKSVAKRLQLAVIFGDEICRQAVIFRWAPNEIEK
ncbi:hypothetical protein CEXT_245351 [Caerostris extrusa]|uniref:Uncharacterized protein n=1 Tax=Caerostris extrusa TaxID=172846 RepID=A0AAV4V7G2_CAEEX|nr:hypothetical protein CEXT_245351 [Caerostris extrusa]